MQQVVWCIVELFVVLTLTYLGSSTLSESRQDNSAATAALWYQTRTLNMI